MSTESQLFTTAIHHLLCRVLSSRILSAANANDTTFEEEVRNVLHAAEAEPDTVLIVERALRNIAKPVLQRLLREICGEDPTAQETSPSDPASPVVEIPGRDATGLTTPDIGQKPSEDQGFNPTHATSNSQGKSERQTSESQQSTPTARSSASVHAVSPPRRAVFDIKGLAAFDETSQKHIVKERFARSFQLFEHLVQFASLRSGRKCTICKDDVDVNWSKLSDEEQDEWGRLLSVLHSGDLESVEPAGVRLLAEQDVLARLDIEMSSDKNASSAGTPCAPPASKKSSYIDQSNGQPGTGGRLKRVKRSPKNPSGRSADTVDVDDDQISAKNVPDVCPRKATGTGSAHADKTAGLSQPPKPMAKHRKRKLAATPE